MAFQLLIFNKIYEKSALKVFFQKKMATFVKAHLTHTNKQFNYVRYTTHHIADTACIFRHIVDTPQSA